MSWREQFTLQCDDDEARFVLDQHALLEFYGASSLTQMSADRYIAPIGHHYLIPSQLDLNLTPYDVC